MSEKGTSGYFAEVTEKVLAVNGGGKTPLFASDGLIKRAFAGAARVNVSPLNGKLTKETARAETAYNQQLGVSENGIVVGQPNYPDIVAVQKAIAAAYMPLLVGAEPHLFTYTVWGVKRGSEVLGWLNKPGDEVALESIFNWWLCAAENGWDVFNRAALAIIDPDTFTLQRARVETDWGRINIPIDPVWLAASMCGHRRMSGGMQSIVAAQHLFGENHQIQVKVDVWKPIDISKIRGFGWLVEPPARVGNFGITAGPENRQQIMQIAFGFVPEM